MRIVFAAALMLFAAACDPRVSPSAPDHHIGDTIREQETAINAAITREDAAAVAAFYAPDAMMFNPGEAVHDRPETIRAAYQMLFDDPNGALSFHSAAVVIPSSGDYASSQGLFSISFTDPASHHRVDMTGNYMSLWRKQDDGSWKIMYDMATPGAPPASPTATPAARRRESAGTAAPH